MKTKHLPVPAETIWDALIGTGRRDWYYRLAADGAFEPGATVRWRDTRGETAEESEVREISAPQLMKLRKEYEAKIEALLTEVQRKRWQQLLGQPFELRD